jgi:uncharacterized protein YyaL (SSP411 family)
MLSWAGRIPSVTDTKMIVAWNSLMISGLARAAAVFHDSTYFELAAKAAQFIRPPARIRRDVPVRNSTNQQSGLSASQTVFCGCGNVLKRCEIS